MNSIVCYDYAGTPLKNLYQWDANQRILISGLDIGIVTEIHFCNPNSTEALVSVPYAYEQYIAVDIPNILLQKSRPLVIYVFQDSIDSGHRTIHSLRIPVYPRPKPADYVYTETEVLCYSKIDERLRALEEGGGSNSTGSESPVKSVNGKFGEVTLNAYDVGARPSTWTPTADEVGALPITYTPPNQTAEQVGADPKGTAASVVSNHNTSTEAHNDLRIELKALADRLAAFLDSDDITLDQLSELIAGINSNKNLIEAVTTGKVSVDDIVNNLTTNVANKPLSAAQGVVLKGLIDDLATRKLDASALTQAINTALAQAKASGEFDGAPGKSAYQYAVDGGYEGTEADFIKKMARDSVTIIDDRNGNVEIIAGENKASVFKSRAVGILPTVHKGTANSEFTLDFESTAVGELQEV